MTSGCRARASSARALRAQTLCAVFITELLQSGGILAAPEAIRCQTGVRMHSLMTRLEGYGFPLSNGTSLSRSLIEKDILTEHRADTALQEYRRFLFLAATGKGPTVPSPLIDAMWHLHLADSRAYHDDLCARVVGQTIHHTPGRPEPRLDPAYPATLGRYAQVFGVPAHPKVWPSPAMIARREAVGVFSFIGITALVLGFAIGVAAFWLTGLALLGAVLIWTQYWGPWPWRAGSTENGLGIGLGGDGDGGGCGGD